MYDAKISQIIQSSAHLPCNGLNLGSRHSDEQGALGVVIQIYVEHLCDD